jgi:sugar phosphate isomerase/epimerase
MNNRRSFLRLTGGLTLGSLLMKAGCTPIKTNQSTTTLGKMNNKALNEFGLQLYTLRQEMPGQPAEMLKQVASFGYKYIESYEGPKGMFWGMGNQGFKKFMDDLGMTLIASHCDINKEFEMKATEAAQIGMKYLICPWIGPQKYIDDYKKAADTFNRCGEICKKAGIRFAYHNHDYSFKILEGQIPQKVLMDETDPNLVDFEMDIYWVVTAGENPVSWLTNYPNRFKLSHIKDRAKEPVADNGKNSVDLGSGSIAFKEILKSAYENGMEYFLVEQEAYPGGSPLEAVKKNAAYLQNLGI